MEIISASSPRYSSADGQTVTLSVEFAGLGEVVPFTARPDDVEPHGRALYQRAVAGEFGAVAAYSAPAVAAKQVKAEAQRRIIGVVGATDLAACMVKQLNMLMRAVELANKRASGQALSGAETTEAAALQAAADSIKDIRSKSNAIEAMSPIPTNYTDNSHWA